MELAFDERKLLVPGIHDVTLDTVKQYFGKFQRTDRRQTLFAKLQDYLQAVKRAGCGQRAIVDGSFVMACVDEPDDIDIVIVLPADWDTTADLPPFRYNLLSKKSVRSIYGLDVFSVKPDSTAERDWIEFFGQVNIKWINEFGWPDHLRKGILRVTL